MSDIDWNKFMNRLRKNLTLNSPIYVKGCIKFYDITINQQELLKKKDIEIENLKKKLGEKNE